MSEGRHFYSYRTITITICVLTPSNCRCTNANTYVSSLCSRRSTRSTLHYRWMFCWSSYQHSLSWSWI